VVRSERGGSLVSTIAYDAATRMSQIGHFSRETFSRYRSVKELSNIFRQMVIVPVFWVNG